MNSSVPGLRVSIPQDSFPVGAVHTLAQSGTTIAGKSITMVVGKGSEMTDSKTAKGRAKRKLITQATALHLIDVSKNKRKPEREKSYWNTYHCQSKITSFGGSIFGNYCKNRFCTLCASIRKADIINRYLPVIQTWEEPYFVTLTAKACTARELPKRIISYLRGFAMIVEKHRKRHQRGKGIKLVGIKSLECNFNPGAKTYNPHFHIIVQNKEMADILVEEWLRICTSKYARSYAQDKREIYNTIGSLVETIKYGSKIFTEPDIKQKIKQKGNSLIYASALDNIFNAMNGHRIFDRFGFNLPKTDKVVHGAKWVIDSESWKFDPKVADWINLDSDEVLSGYCAPDDLLRILGFGVDIHLE